MRDEIDVKSKTDVLDFIISFIVEHEKRMDHMTERLEKITEKFGKSPEDFEPIKSIRIDWNDTGKSFHPDDLEFDSILKDIEFTFRDDARAQ
jgi:uncharacterized coiled-coil protein SlyX